MWDSGFTYPVLGCTEYNRLFSKINRMTRSQYIIFIVLILLCALLFIMIQLISTAVLITMKFQVNDPVYQRATRAPITQKEWEKYQCQQDRQTLGLEKKRSIELTK